MSKQAVVAALIVLLSASAAYLLIKSRKPAEPRAPNLAAPLVDIVLARPAALVIPVETQGTVTAKNETEIAPELAGKVVWISPSFTPGGSFGPSEVLFRIDDREYRLAYEQAQARVAQARVRVVQAEAEAGQSVREWERLSDQPPPPLASREPFVDEARATYSAALADVERAQLALQRTSVRAPPYQGRVLGVATGLGQFVSPGRPVAKVFGTGNIEVRLPFTDKQRLLAGLPPPGADIQTSPTVTLSALLAGEMHEWNASLVRTEATVDPRTRVLYAVAEIPNDPTASSLSVGQFVSARISGAPLPDLFLLPRSALQPDDRLFVADSGNRLELRSVDVIHKGDETIAVRSGIAVGDRVIVSPLDYPVPGMAVDPRLRDDEAP